MRRRWSGFVLVAVLALTGCTATRSGDSPEPAPAISAGLTTGASLSDLQTAIAAGQECAELFEVFDRISESSPDFPAAQGEIGNVGCYMRTSTRSDGDLRSAAPNSPWLGVPGSKVDVSAQCGDAMVAAADESDGERAEPLIAATLDACASVDEWMSGLEEHPGVLGMVDGYIPKLFDLQVVCHTYASSVVCADAAARGINIDS